MTGNPNQSNQSNQDELPGEMAAEERLASLLLTLGELRDYLDERGQHTYELAQRFMANAQRDPASRAYDERQAAMLEYQHYIWREIAGRVGQILAAHGGDESGDADSVSDESDTGGDESDGESDGEGVR